MDTLEKKAPELCVCDYCKEYEYQYNKIMNNNPKWLTISPAHNDTTPEDEYNDWLTDLEPLLKCADLILGVVEFAQFRMHFHIMFSCKDPIKSYKVVNKIRQCAMVRIYNGGPKEGLHYLFKDINESKELIPNSSVIFTDQYLTDRRRIRIINNRKKIQQNICNEISIEDISRRWGIGVLEREPVD